MVHLVCGRKVGPTPCTLHPTLYNEHPTPYPYPSPYYVHLPTPYSLLFIPYSLLPLRGFPCHPFEMIPSSRDATVDLQARGASLSTLESSRGQIVSQSPTDVISSR